MIIQELIQQIVERLRIPDEKSEQYGFLYDAQPDGRPNGIALFASPESPPVTATVSEQGDYICLRFDDDGQEYLILREELLGKPN